MQYYFPSRSFLVAFKSLLLPYKFLSSSHRFVQFPSLLSSSNCSKMSTSSSTSKTVIMPDPDIDRKLTSHQLELSIPEGAELMEHQVAGHRFGLSKHKLGLLRHSSSRDILKPICDKRSERECRFYELIFHGDDETDRCVQALRSLVPKYNGLFHDARMNVNYIRLTDLTVTLKNASVLDMKMGRITYDPEASEVKKRSELSKYRYATELGFRILGMRIFDRNTQKYINKDKDCGLEVTPDNASQAILTFVQHDPCLVAQLHQQLTAIRRWFREVNLHRFKFISSSLFFVYGEEVVSSNLEDPAKSNHDLSDHLPNNNNLEANIYNHSNHNQLENDLAPPQPRYRALIRMIDFAHVFPNDQKNSVQSSSSPEEPSDGIDHNYLFGLDKLDHYLGKAASELNNNNNAKS